MKISVIIPTYNRINTIKRAIDSVLNQTYKNFEVLIIDDGSTDNTGKFIENNYKDSRINYFYSKNKGVSFARNLGIKKSSGEWIAFLDSDDEWLLDKLKKQYEIAKEGKYLLIHGDEIWIKNSKRINQKNIHKKSGGDIFKRSLRLCLISPSAVMINRCLFDDVGVFDESFPVCEDYDLWLRITSRYNIGFINSPIITKYGGTDNQLSTKYKAMDYFRVLSMVKLLKDRRISSLNRDDIYKEIQYKSNILINGYKKYKNFKKLAEIKSIVNSL